MEGEDVSSFFSICFSTIFLSTGAGSKKNAQITNINVESTTANIKFFDSIYFLPFLRFGTGSNPLFPPKTLMGWHLKILLMPRKLPFRNPFNFKESMKYSEQVGRYLQRPGKKGDIKYL
tara:strand:- start:532 stop:888 length:357 start_codon:yes stop_codon:yes gene_type:complete